MANLHEILQTIQTRDFRDLGQEDINKMLLEIIDQSMAGEHGAKGLEVALRAIIKLSEGLAENSLTATDETIKEKLPVEVLRLLGQG